MDNEMIYKINDIYCPIEVYEWFLINLKSNGNNKWVSNKYNENGFKVKELIIL